jgi:hypothetical protein
MLSATAFVFVSAQYFLFSHETAVEDSRQFSLQRNPLMSVVEIDRLDLRLQPLVQKAWNRAQLRSSPVSRASRICIVFEHLYERILVIKRKDRAPRRYFIKKKKKWLTPAHRGSAQPWAGPRALPLSAQFSPLCTPSTDPPNTLVRRLVP